MLAALPVAQLTTHMYTQYTQYTYVHPVNYTYVHPSLFKTMAGTNTRWVQDLRKYQRWYFLRSCTHLVFVPAIVLKREGCTYVMV